eukprot:2458920-Pyramimonas_sp.AAC.1
MKCRYILTTDQSDTGSAERTPPAARPRVLDLYRPRPACDASRAKGERCGRKWGTGYRVRKERGSISVECILAVIGTGGPVK